MEDRGHAALGFRSESRRSPPAKNLSLNPVPTPTLVARRSAPRLERRTRSEENKGAVAIDERRGKVSAFLVERDRETEFDAVVNKIAKKYGKRLKFKYTGPWPPYNFVNIRLKLERLSPD